MRSFESLYVYRPLKVYSLTINTRAMFVIIASHILIWNQLIPQKMMKVSRKLSLNILCKRKKNFMQNILKIQIFRLIQKNIQNFFFQTYTLKPTTDWFSNRSIELFEFVFKNFLPFFQDSLSVLINWNCLWKKKFFSNEFINLIK
jgi:type IV secretory pathway VirB3-like protein